MAARVPVVATSVGAQGLNVEDGVHLRIADEAGLFAEAIIELMVNREEARRLVRAAYDRVEQQYSWAGIYDGVIERLEEEVVQAKSVQ
jgi:glycosyltransferase involved in cell wall biosynthesis